MIRNGLLMLIVLIITVSAISYFINSGLVIVAIVIVGFSLMTALIAQSNFWLHRKLDSMSTDIEQLAPYLTINGLFNDAPLPFSRFAITPDTGALLVREIFYGNPENIVEFGSGLSTVIMAKCVSRLGKGHIYSVEQDKDWAERTRSLLKIHGLEAWCTVIHSEITYTPEGKWYSTDILPVLPKNIQFLFIDGPRAQDDPFIRFPALPILWDRLAKNTLIFLDDGKREGEKKIVSDWEKRFQGKINIEYLESQRGTWLIRKV